MYVYVGVCTMKVTMEYGMPNVTKIEDDQSENRFYIQKITVFSWLAQHVGGHYRQVPLHVYHLL